jgi:hypothetical protein
LRELVPTHNYYLIYFKLLQNKRNTINILEIGLGTNNLGKLGEGRTKCWFFNIEGSIVMLFIDSRGSTWEFEDNTKKGLCESFQKCITFLTR